MQYKQTLARHARLFRKDSRFIKRSVYYAKINQALFRLDFEVGSIKTSDKSKRLLLRVPFVLKVVRTQYLKILGVP